MNVLIIMIITNSNTCIPGFQTGSGQTVVVTKVPYILDIRVAMCV